MSLRNERVRKTLMKEIADIIQKDIQDSRIATIVSVTDIEISHDNSFAKIFFSVFGSDEVREKTMEALEEHKSKIRYEVGKRVRLRHTPDLKFFPDDSLERGSKVTELIKKISQGEI